MNDNRLLQEMSEPTVIEHAAYILMSVGAFVFLISFIGYCGAVKESRALLTAYGLFIVILTLSQAAFVVLASMNKERAAEGTRSLMRHTLREHYTVPERRDAVTLSWDFMMAKLECCGVDNGDDFGAIARKFRQLAPAGQRVPAACCQLKEGREGLMLLVPKDENCLHSPTGANSHISQVTIYTSMHVSNMHVLRAAIR